MLQCYKVTNHELQVKFRSAILDRAGELPRDYVDENVFDDEVDEEVKQMKSGKTGDDAPAAALAAVTSELKATVASLATDP